MSTSPSKITFSLSSLSSVPVLLLAEPAIVVVGGTICSIADFCALWNLCLCRCRCVFVPATLLHRSHLFSVYGWENLRCLVNSDLLVKFSGGQQSRQTNLGVQGWSLIQEICLDKISNSPLPLRKFSPILGRHFFTITQQDIPLQE